MQWTSLPLKPNTGYIIHGYRTLCHPTANRRDPRPRNPSLIQQKPVKLYHHRNYVRIPTVSSPHNSGTDSSRRQSNNTAEGFIVLYSTDDHGQISLSCGLLPHPFLLLFLSSRVDDYKFNKSSNIYTLQGLPAGTSSFWFVCFSVFFFALFQRRKTHFPAYPPC